MVVFCSENCSLSISADQETYELLSEFIYKTKFELMLTSLNFLQQMALNKDMC